MKSIIFIFITLLFSILLLLIEWNKEPDTTPEIYPNTDKGTIKPTTFIIGIEIELKPRKDKK